MRNIIQSKSISYPVFIIINSHSLFFTLCLCIQQEVNNYRILTDIGSYFDRRSRFKTRACEGFIVNGGQNMNQYRSISLLLTHIKHTFDCIFKLEKKLTLLKIFFKCYHTKMIQLQPSKHWNLELGANKINPGQKTPAYNIQDSLEANNTKQNN